jgi:iron complex transport system substrate-binding protein
MFRLSISVCRILAALLLLTACGGPAANGSRRASTAAPATNRSAVSTAPSSPPQARSTPAVASPDTPPALRLASPAASPVTAIPGVVDPANQGWPRQVQALNGRITIAAKPQRIHTVSLGFDEVTFALVPATRVVAVGSYTQQPDYSNVAAQAQNLPAVAREPEPIIAQHPDIVLADALTKPELIRALQTAGITVVQLGLHNTPDGRIQDILLLGYIYGEEARARQFAAEVRSRYTALETIIQTKPSATRPRVLSLTSYADKLYTAGRGSTEGSIIEAAGGRNVAAEAGIERNQTTNLEGIIAMSPSIIVIPQVAGGAAFRQQLLANPALSSVPAINAQRVYVVPAKFFTTLSFWNIRGAEELAKLLWPDDFAGRTFPPFSLPGGS